MYTDTMLSPQVFATGREMLGAAFPKLTEDWFRVLLAQTVGAAFTNDRFTAAVNDLIRTCEYPEPTVARILDFDRKITLLDYIAMCEKWTLGLGKFYKMVRKADATHQPLWASIEDIERYRLPFVEQKDETPEASPTEDEPPAPLEIAERVRAEMQTLAMKARTRLSAEEFETNKRRAQEALERDK